MKSHRVLFALLVLAWVTSPTISARAELTLVTVTGRITKTNRPPYNAFDDALFKVQDLSFEKAYALSRSMLASLPQQTVTTRYPGWPADATVSGPYLSAVLSAAGAKGETVVVRAVDGYAPEFSMAEISAAKFVLAIEANGKPLGIGGRGPTWLVTPPRSYEGQPEDDSPLAWAVFHIEVR